MGQEEGCQQSDAEAGADAIAVPESHVRPDRVKDEGGGGEQRGDGENGLVRGEETADRSAAGRAARQGHGDEREQE